MQTEKLNPRMFTLAREARGYSQAELAEASGVSRQSISHFELNNVQLSEGFIMNLADALKFATALYKLDKETLPPATYRRRDTIPAKLLTKIDALINLYAFGIAHLLNAISFDQLNVPLYPVSETQTPEQAAMQTRSAWQLPAGPVTNLIAAMEANGFITLPVDFETERIDSRSILIDDKFPVIFYNKKLQGDRLRFTLAYELGHIVMHTRSKVLRLDDSHEANVFAAEFLMPKADIVKDLNSKIDVEELGLLKNKWLVSMQSILYRAEDLGVITENHKRYLVNRFNQLQIRRREPKELDVAIERGHLLRDLITKYRSKQKMNVKQIAEFFYMKEDEFQATFNSMSNN